MLTGSASTLARSFSASDSGYVYRPCIDWNYFCMAGFASLCTWSSNRLLFDQASGECRGRPQASVVVDSDVTGISEREV